MAPKLGARKNKAFKAVSTAPSFNKTPIGPSTLPVPYPVFQDLGVSAGTVTTVNFNGDPAYVLGQSSQPTCVGDAPGVALGVKSNTVSGEIDPKMGSTTVNAGGRPIVREGDDCSMNGGNCPGVYVAMAWPEGAICDFTPVQAEAPITPETLKEWRAAKERRGFWGRFWQLLDFLADVDEQIDGVNQGIGEAVVDMGVGLKELGVAIVKNDDLYGLIDPEGQQAQRERIRATLVAIADDPGLLIDCIVQPYKEAIAKGEYGKAFGRGLVEIGSFFVGGAGVAGKAGEAASTVGKVGRGASAAARLEEAVGASGRVGSKVASEAEALAKAESATVTVTKRKFLGAGETYLAHESGKYGLLAELDAEGFLNLYIKAKEGVTPRGGQMFKEAMEQFGPNVKGVRGTWIGGGEIADNFDAFKAALKAGATPEEAAFKTFTGKMARRSGFTTAKVVQNDAGKVVVEFAK